MGQDRINWLLLMTNRKLHTRFRLVPKSMTLQWPWTAISHSVSKCMRNWEPTTKIWMKVDPYYQRHRCSPMWPMTLLVSGNIRFMRIFAVAPWSEGVKRQWGNRKRWFSGLSDASLRHLRKWGRHYYIVLFSPLSTFHWPQNYWPWMTFNGHLP